MSFLEIKSFEPSMWYIGDYAHWCFNGTLQRVTIGLQIFGDESWILEFFLSCRQLLEGILENQNLNQRWNIQW
jgi:hypothetical protein